MDVVLVGEGKDRHGVGCACGDCNSNGHAYECAVYAADDVHGDRLFSEYAPSEDGAWRRARIAAEEQGWTVVEGEE